MKKNRFQDEYDGCALQGDSWFRNCAYHHRTHERGWTHPSIREDNLGFRCIIPEDTDLAKRLVRIK